jgi:hypothetical protein
VQRGGTDPLLKVHLTRGAHASHLNLPRLHDAAAAVRQGCGARNLRLHLAPRDGRRLHARHVRFARRRPGTPPSAEPSAVWQAGLLATRADFAPCRARVQSHCRFRNRATTSIRQSGIRWLHGGAKRQWYRTLRRAPQGVDPLAKWRAEVGTPLSDYNRNEIQWPGHV